MEYIIFVIDHLSNSATKVEMDEINRFNDFLRLNNHLIYAAGLAAPEKAKVIDNRENSQKEISASHFSDPETYSGFWLIRAESDEVANKLAFDGSKACNRKVELRPLL